MKLKLTDISIRSVIATKMSVLTIVSSLQTQKNYRLANRERASRESPTFYHRQPDSNDRRCRDREPSGRSNRFRISR